MSSSSAQSGRPSRRRTVARVGQAGWFFANLYEGLVGVPQLLADARPRRRPGLLAPGSPVRYFAPVAPFAVVSSGAALAEQWRAGADRRLLGAAGAGFVVASAASAYSIRTVNVPVLVGHELPGAEHETIALWHRTNTVRLVALGVAIVALSAAERRPHR